MSREATRSGAAYYGKRTMADIEKQLKALAKIEKRLKALEKRAQTNDEVWQTLDGHIKAFSLVIDAIGAPICATIPSIGKTIITNLRNFENAGKNNNDVTIRQLRHAREFFEAQIKKSGKGNPLPASDVAPRRRR
jgi:hypothetical protein